MMRLRLLIGAVGILLLAYGVKVITPLLGSNHPVSLAKWLIAVVIVHDAIIAPVTIGLGGLVTRVVPARGRRYLQGFLISSALVVAVAIPIIHRAGRSAHALALLEQDYRLHLALLVAGIGVVTTLAYALRVRRDRTSSAKTRPPADQVSVTE